jgi:hypothetical protein
MALSVDCSVLEELKSTNYSLLVLVCRGGEEAYQEDVFLFKDTKEGSREPEVQPGASIQTNMTRSRRRPLYSCFY